LASPVVRQKAKKQRSGLCFVSPARPVPLGLSDLGVSCRASKVEGAVHLCSGRYRLARPMSTRVGLGARRERPGDDSLDDLALRVGVVLDVGPVAGRARTASGGEDSTRAR